MSDSNRRLLGAASALTLAVASIQGCRHQAPPVAAPPALPPQQLAPPVPASANAPTLAPDTAREPHVDVDTHNTDADVRPLLDFVARAGGFTLVYPQSLNRKVRVQLNDVPVSVALRTLLSLANLEIETTTPGARPPSRSSVVFYELPVNVDSLSADAIVKRFGVGRAIADLIVDMRTNKP